MPIMEAFRTTQETMNTPESLTRLMISSVWRWSMNRWARPSMPAWMAMLTRNLVLNVIAEAPGEMTVGGIAAEMGVTQPVASRTIAACIADGLLRRVASQADGRRTVLELTDVGETERHRFAAEQRETFERITAEWEPAERVQFAQFLVRYSQDASAWSARQRPRSQDNASARSEG